MKNIIISLIFILCSLNIFSQSNNFTKAFKASYNENPNIPKGLLEAISYSKTHISNLDTNQTSCMGLAIHYGPMGLVNENNSYLNNTAKLISEITNVDINKILKEPYYNITSYAKALAFLSNNSTNIYDYFASIKQLSELPSNTENQMFTLDTELYSIALTLSNKKIMSAFNLEKYKLDFKKIFGDNLALLSAKKITIKDKKIYDDNGNIYKSSCQDYPLGLWVASPNYNSRGSTAITDVTIHTVQGSYSGCISYFQSTSSGVSAHYVIRSIDGQVTQMVCESDRAWHVGTENSYCIGIEHEGYVSDPSWYTNSMYQSSADLVRDITNSGYGISPISSYRGTSQSVLNSCYHIKGHVHFPNQTHSDPGVNWDWERFYHLINDNLMTNYEYNYVGEFTDNGGQSNPYNSFENYMTVIYPQNIDSVMLSFTSFNLENGYDSMTIYDGLDTNGIFLGTYTGTNSPGNVVGASGKLAIVFYSDCLIHNDGWHANWTSFPNFTSIEEYNSENTLIKIIDLLGREINPRAIKKNILLLYIYSDGTIEKKINTY